MMMMMMMITLACCVSQAPLPSHLQGRDGMSLELGGGTSQPGCNHGRTLRYDMVCAKGKAAAHAAPNATMFIYDTPARKIDPIPGCAYVVEWHHPAACSK